MITRRFTLPIALAVAAFALSGCSFSANLTVSAASVAKAAEDALEAQVGSRPDIVCGDADAKVDLVNGTVVDCVLTDPATTSVFDAQVTIDKVEGTNYRVDVQVANTPRADGKGAETPKNEEPKSETPTGGITHQVEAEAIEKLAANALFNEAPPYYQVDCGAGELEVSLGAVFNCSATHPDGKVHDATITVTEITETGYNINVVRAAQPRQ